ncbi:hypothetical protein PBY51_020668 [Eleginops maclovinus]|uniref:Inositol 1,4,5-trisphosphate receptor-interacting protein n=1 Tax=Eleginops maclovinus TaxID=56733 RepID=A0AAN7XQJ9_ELEMC|nr:hypothetical protein PBY51_020668 [Eleginops maclovinus]
MMQDILLRVFVVALGLLTYPREDPGVEELDDFTTVGMQKHEERLLREEEKMAPANEEIMHTDNGDPPDGFYPDQYVTEKITDLEDVTVTKQESEEDVADHNVNFTEIQPQNPQSEPETVLKTSQIAQDLSGNVQFDEKSTEDTQTDSSFPDPGSPQGPQEKPEVIGSNEQESPSSPLHTVTSEKKSSEKDIADWERDYLWYLWNALSLISMIRFFRKYLGKNSQMKQEETKALSVTCTSAEVLLPDSATLQQFHSKCIQVSSDKWKEFLEGFASDLLEAMRAVCDINGGMVIEDIQIVDMCNIIVPFTPPDPYSFKCLLNQASDQLPDMQACGQIKLVENNTIQHGCPCQSPNSEDMVCLLHCETEKVKTKKIDGLLCVKNSPFLSKLKVTTWFQSTIKQAWEQISHKYEFELNIRYISAPGALVVRFRSGKTVSFRMNPVVKIHTDAHFFINPNSNGFDTFWALSLTIYEDRFLEHISKRLPVNSCHRQTLEIAHFLHKRQTAISGNSSLRNIHFKTALMHLVFTKDPSEWKPNFLTCRLQDLLAFMERSLKKKQLQHILIGNPLRQRVIELPAEFTQAKTVNLFHPLVAHNCIYRNAVVHFQEMLRNAHMLINDYVKCIEGTNCAT